MMITINGKEVNATRIHISAKCSDLFHADLQDKNGKALAQHDGYVPDFMPGKHWGDYVILDIDLETGTILNWKRPTKTDLEEIEWKESE